MSLGVIGVGLQVQGILVDAAVAVRLGTVLAF